MSIKYYSIEEQINAHKWIDENHSYNGSPCWRWFGCTVDGYGVIQFKGKPVKVHRLVASLYLGLDLSNESVKVCHHCDIRNCFNPGHLFLGSTADNRRDSANKANSRSHCKHGHIFDKDNTGINNRGQRFCRVCVSKQARKCIDNKKNLILNKELIQ